MIAAPKVIVFCYLRLLLLVFPYAIILIAGHGIAPLGFLVFFSGPSGEGWTDPNVGRLGWAGLVIAAAAPLIAPKRFYTLAVSAATAFLVASALSLVAQYADSTSAGVDRFTLSLFYICAAIYVLWEWLLALRRGGWLRSHRTEA